MTKTVVMIPTYNEAGNIQQLLRSIQALKIPALDILVVDDNSPDGTAALAQTVPGVNVLVRTTDRGRGRAGIAGFKWALDHDADNILEMDADLSHDPKYLPAMLEAARGADVVIGSRYCKGGKDVNRGLSRRVITWAAQNY